MTCSCISQWKNPPIVRPDVFFFEMLVLKELIKLKLRESSCDALLRDGQGHLASDCNSEPTLCHSTDFSCKVTSVFVAVFEFLGPLTGSDRGQTDCRVYLKKHHLTPF